ncbi:hypothetical protein IWQ56_004926, partial [Coemansia nantahalensis]
MTIAHGKRVGGPSSDDAGQPAARTLPLLPPPPPPPPLPPPRPTHPCFWAVLDGECLNIAFVSTSLHSFLGSEQAAGMLGQSLFDYIHPEEAARARRDLADTFVSKPLV